MKALAERFEGTMTGWNAADSDNETLRLLPRSEYFSSALTANLQLIHCRFRHFCDDTLSCELLADENSINAA
jgi:hypothetical protein